jgi:NADPH:quinone reductase-like Zn-dependent oxidoreductase
MKAAVRTQYGPPEVLSIREVEKPQPKDNEVRVKVQAATVNRTDCGILWAKPAIIRLFTGLSRPKLATTGTDFAGEVEATGKNITRFKVGDRVWGFDDNGLS